MNVTSLAAALAILIGFITFFVWISRRVRRGGGGQTAGMLGAAHEMLSEDRRRAGETILEERAGKKLHEEESGDPEGNDGEPEET